MIFLSTSPLSLCTILDLQTIAFWQEKPPVHLTTQTTLWCYPKALISAGTLCQEIRNISPSFTLFRPFRLTHTLYWLRFLLYTPFSYREWSSHEVISRRNCYTLRRTSPIIQRTASSTRVPDSVPYPCPDPTTSLRLGCTLALLTQGRHWNIHLLKECTPFVQHD
jgi:hypothetical protein